MIAICKMIFSSVFTTLSLTASIRQFGKDASVFEKKFLEAMSFLIFKILQNILKCKVIVPIISTTRSLTASTRQFGFSKKNFSEANLYFNI